MMLIKLDLPYALPEFDAERESKPVAVSPSRLKRENPTQVVRKESEVKTIPFSIKRVKQDNKVGSDLIPSIENFRGFKIWMLKKLDELENVS